MTIVHKYSQTIRYLTNKDDKEDGLLLTNKTEICLKERLVDWNILAACTVENGRAGSIDSYFEHLMSGTKSSSTPMCLYFHHIYIMSSGNKMISRAGISCCDLSTKWI
jgi:hypothetical protein